eukprot:scaffold113645_cov45-Prasinocladus_malaysianus.AAC.2
MHWRYHDCITHTARIEGVQENQEACTAWMNAKTKFTSLYSAGEAAVNTYSYRNIASPDFSGPRSESSPGTKVVGCGGIGIDYLASVASYPKPDDKLRTQALQ